MKYYLRLLVLTSCLYLLSACTNVSTPDNNTETTNAITQNTSVNSIIVKRTVFNKELLCNGILRPVKSAKIMFEVNEMITTVNVINGQLVKKGDLLATLNNEQISLNLQKANCAFEKAKIELRDIMISYNYNRKDSDSTDNKIMHFAKIKSGYYDAEINLKECKINFEKSKLFAPFNGVITRLQAKENNPSISYNYLCFVTENNLMEVDFNVMENELEYIKNCKNITITTSALTNEFLGQIESIDPFVDANGMIKVTAKVKNNNNLLLEGMNVNVKILQSFPDKIVVPKLAVLKRQGKDVIFTLKADSIIQWNYVNVDMENSSMCTINEGITENDTIVINNNKNLGHNVIVNNNLILSKKSS